MTVSEGRFELRGELGSGGMGKVHRVFDRARGEEVAIKALHLGSGVDIFRFKREFRALAELVHPNLVRLHELFVEGDQWMFTMELVEGAPFDAAMRGLDPAERRARIVQLVDGIAAIHAAGKVHRDLKPSNVLVEPGGRVVILDFGLVTDALGSSDGTHIAMAVGTPAYMSPEQAADRPLTPASDGYALGAMLYEVLTGRRPFEGQRHAVMHDKQYEDPTPLAHLAPDAPADLATVCTMLLAREPAARPSAIEVLEMLGAHASPATQRIATRWVRARPGELQAELAVLRQALADSRDHCVGVVLIGEQGAGKTTLLETFAAELADTDTVVLRGRASNREALTYRAVDTVVDSLASYLSTLERSELAALLRPESAVIARVFPAFRRVRGAEIPQLPGAAPLDDAELRRRTFAAMADIMRRIAIERPVVIVVDDAQYGNAAGAQVVVDHWVGPDAPRCLIVFGYRDDPTGRPLLDILRAWPGDLRTLQLAPRPPGQPDLGKPAGS